MALRSNMVQYIRGVGRVIQPVDERGPTTSGVPKCRITRCATETTRDSVPRFPSCVRNSRGWAALPTLAVRGLGTSLPALFFFFFPPPAPDIRSALFSLLSPTYLLTHRHRHTRFLGVSFFLALTQRRAFLCNYSTSAPIFFCFFWGASSTLFSHSH